MHVCTLLYLFSQLWDYECYLIFTVFCQVVVEALQGTEMMAGFLESSCSVMPHFTHTGSSKRLAKTYKMLDANGL